MDTAITFYTQQPGHRDADGIWRPGEEQERTVPCRKYSLRQSEFYRAGQAGLAAVCYVSLQSAEYRNERECSVDGQRLTVYRTYITGDEIELYLAERTGNATGD